jgi:probable F420-dependent oxidoreductase
MARPFRFLAPMPRLDQPAGRWRDAVRRIEDLGFATVSISDHFTRGWVMEPVVAMTAAAAATDRLRVLSLVLGNDYRHPVLVHKAMATLDVLSEGRVELGLGAGWMRSDYQAAGLPYDEPAERIERLEESVAVLKGLFGPEPLTFAGTHYRIDELDGLPKPVQRPHPPLLVGGGGRKVLSVAGRHADIVSVNPSLRDGVVTADLLEDATAERIDQKVAWVREAAAAAGRRPDEVELQLNLLVCQVAGRAGQARRAVSSLAGGADPGLLEKSPAVLAGSVGQCVEAVQERRERFGISYVNLGGDVEAVAPIVARLAGT